MTNTKMTKKNALVYVLSTYTDIPTDVREKLESMYDSLERKADAPRKSSAQAIANVGLRADIIMYLSTCENPQCIADMIANIPALNGATSQKVSGLLTPLVKKGKIVKQMIKRKAYFSFAE